MYRAIYLSERNASVTQVIRLLVCAVGDDFHLLYSAGVLGQGQWPSSLASPHCLHQYRDEYHVLDLQLALSTIISEWC